VDKMLNTLAATFQWMQALLTAGNYDALVPSLLEKVNCPQLHSARNRSHRYMHEHKSAMLRLGPAYNCTQDHTFALLTSKAPF
jgi:hypothetical protein